MAEMDEAASIEVGTPEALEFEAEGDPVALS